MEESLSVPAVAASDAANGKFKSTKGNQITIKRSALKDAFLLTPSMIVATNEPILDALQAKVVSFEERGDSLALLELNKYAVYEGLPSERILSVFKIVSSTEEEITFDWNLQFSALSLKDGMGVSDFPESLTEQMNPMSSALSITASFIKSAKIVGEQLEIVQVVRVKMDSVTGPAEPTIHLNVRIQPYKINPKFVAKPSTLQKVLGYFEVATNRQGDGQIDVFATRWDMSPELPPVVFSISKDVPNHMIDAVKEGVLYWNRVAGRELFQVETGADPAEIPQYRRATIHWVPWMKGSFARANMQTDPITGEILSASVFATSFWDVGGQELMRRFLPVGVEGFKHSTVCNFHRSHNPLENFTASDPDLAMRGAQDFVRMMIAHEVGHTLGLRHNFAGTIGSIFSSYKDRAKVWKEYITQENHPGADVTTSVMDYTSRGDDFLSGRFLKTGVHAYDKMAVQWGYGVEEVAEKDVPYFCTDAERIKGEILGCEIGDTGKNPIDGYLGTLEESHAMLGNRVINFFLKHKFPRDQRNKKSFKEAAPFFDPATFAGFSSDAFDGAVKFLRGKPTAMEADRYQGGRNWMSEEEYQKVAFQLISQRFDEVGGLPALLNAALLRKDRVSKKSGWLLEQVQARLKDPSFTMGKTPEGVDYRLSDRELRELSYYVELAAKKVEEKYLDKVLASTLSPEKPFASELLKDEWQADIADVGRELLFDSEGEIAFELDGEPVRLPKPKFKKEQRLQGLKFLSRITFPKGKWAEPTRKLVESTFEGRLGAAANRDGVGELEPKDKMDIAEDKIIVLLVKNSSGKLVPKKGLPKEAMEWLAEEMEVYTAFMTMKAQEGY